jgi:RHS repeat-associated protein
VTPPGESAHVFSFTAVNLLSSYTPPVVPGTGPTYYMYDADHRLSIVTRPDGGTVKYTYEHGGRLYSVVTPTATLTYSYSPTTCNLATVTSSGGEQLTYGYNGSLLTSTTWTGPVAGSVSHVYDNNSWVKSESITGGTSIALNHDDDGLLYNAGALTLNRTANNGLITGTTIGGASDTRGYNSYGELASYTASYKGTPIYSFELTRDNLGRITTKSETIGGQTTTYEYVYDLSDRLVSVSPSASFAGSPATWYTYDSNSNRLTKRVGNVWVQGNFSYDAQDRLIGIGPASYFGSTSYTYTANGELASKTHGGLTSYQYDVFGNLLAVTLPDGTKINYIIDPQNRRIGKKVNGTLVAGFLYDGERLVVQLNASNTIVSQFIYASEESVPDYMLVGGVSYRIFSDQLGSPRLVVNTSTGQIAERIDYDEFGNVITDTNPGFQPFGFAGGLYDQDTKLVRFAARDYDPQTGRWTAKDPIAFAGGDTNLYGYVLNDPINAVDVAGSAVKVCWSSILGFGGPAPQPLSHWWIETGEKKVGMGGLGWGLLDLFAGVQWTDQSYKYNVYKNAGEIQCKEITNADESCVNRETWEWTMKGNTSENLGHIYPGHTCQEVVNTALAQCQTNPMIVTGPPAGKTFSDWIYAIFVGGSAY